MLSIPARTVYIDPEVYERPNCAQRLERMLPHVQCDDLRPYDEAAREEVAAVSKRRHGKDDFRDDALIVFTTYEPTRRQFYYHLRTGAGEGGRHDGICQDGMQLNLVDGCVFRCAYCGFGRRVIFPLDVERWMAELPQVFGAYPRQRLYKFSNMTDLPPFEPELDAVAPMIQLFASEPDRYLMLFTKSDNLDFLLDLPHNGHTIISWSLTCDSASRLIDRRTASLANRIEAMRRCREAGYIVRARLSPIVPVRNWRSEYEQLLERLFATARPDIVTLEMIGWMQREDLLEIVDEAMLDPEAVAAMTAPTDKHWGPFSEAYHQEVYRYLVGCVRRLSPGTPVAPCHGTPETWAAIGHIVEMGPGGYLCNCGGLCTPGAELYDQWACAGTA